MAKKQSLMFKCVQGNTDLTLTAKVGESLLIKDIMIYNPVTNYVTCKVDKSTVGYFRVGGNLGNHLPLAIGSNKHSHSLVVAAADGALAQDHALSDAHGISNAHIAVFSDRAALTTETDIVQYGTIPNVRYMSLLGYLLDKGIFKGYPVSEGETFLITGAAQAGAVQLIVYEVYDAGDIKNTDDNGSKSNKYFFINYGRVAADVVTTVSTVYNTPQSPAEFPDFPFGKTVPADYRVTLYGVLGSEVVDDRSGGDCMNTEYLKLVRSRETLFDDDKNGILFKGLIGKTDGAAEFSRGVSLIGNLSDLNSKPPFMFPEPIVFNAGDELNVYISTTAGAAQNLSDLLVADLEIGLITVVEVLK